LIDKVTDSVVPAYGCLACSRVFTKAETTELEQEHCGSWMKRLTTAARAEIAAQLESKAEATEGDHDEPDEDESKTSATENLEREHRRLAAHFPGVSRARHKSGTMLDGVRRPKLKRLPHAGRLDGERL